MLPPTAAPATSQLATPPFHTTVPPNPQYSSPSTASSSSRESKAEPHTQIAANDFLWATLQSAEDCLEKFAWYPDSYRLETTYTAPEGGLADH
jgi:hypothetical protein